MAAPDTPRRGPFHAQLIPCEGLHRTNVERNSNVLKNNESRKPLERNRLRLLPGMPRQTGGVAVYPQLLCAACLQLILR